MRERYLIEVETIITELKEIAYKNGALVSEINPLLSLLQDHIKTSSFQPSKQAWLQQILVLIRQWVYYRELRNNSGNYFLWRDKCMADNVLWIKEQNPNSKLIVWAHNWHVMKTDNMQGYHLAQKLGNDYINFGFTFFDGSYMANGSKGLTSYDAAIAFPGTLEYLLNQLNEPLFILDLKKIKADNHKDTKWLMEYLLYRYADERGSNPPPEFSGLRNISDDFDYLIFIKTSSPSSVFLTP